MKNNKSYEEKIAAKKLWYNNKKKDPEFLERIKKRTKEYHESGYYKKDQVNKRLEKRIKNTRCVDTENDILSRFGFENIKDVKSAYMNIISSK